MDRPQDDPVPDDELIEVCGRERGRYTCCRPPGHVPSTLHAQPDGAFVAYWFDYSIGVTLKRDTKVPLSF
jgi:hypothetical protein